MFKLTHSINYLPRAKSRGKQLTIIYLICFFCLSFFVVANPVLAQESSEKKEKDSLLWTKTECKAECTKIQEETIKKIEASGRDPSDIEDAKIKVRAFSCVDTKGVDAKDTNLCYCLAPPMVVDLQVPIGETKVVYGLVDYIVTFFTWGTRAIAVIAVLMIMFSGIMWITAAGNQTAIGKAKERIKNSIVGLILVLGSVFLLNLINPALTDLSALEIRMVPTIAQRSYFCDSLPEGALLTVQSTAEDQKKSVKSERAFCGKKYNIPGNGECIGRFCLDDENCVLDVLKEEKGDYICRSAEDVKKICESLNTDDISRLGFSNKNEACNALSLPKENSYCLFSKDLNFRVMNSVLLKSGCLWVQYNCGRIKECSDYNFYFGYFSGDKYLQDFADAYKEICEMDPCKITGGCSYTKTGLLNKVGHCTAASR